MSTLYAEHFGFRCAPFSIAPDPAFLFRTAAHREAFAHLRYGVETDGGFVLLTGDVGTGKTTLCRALIDDLPADVDLAYVLNPAQGVEDLLATLCEELGAPQPESDPLRPPPGSRTKALVDRLTAHLLATHAAGRRTLLLIDEAQNLDRAVLEQIRLLTNLETDRHKLLRIILVGQPELRAALARDDLRQLDQRVTARCHLRGLTAVELRGYVRHRLDAAGFRGELFGPGALRRLRARTGGVPRLVNSVCDRALLGAYARDRRRVDAGTLDRAADEVLGARRRTEPLAAAVAAGVAAVALAGLVAFPWPGRTPGPGPAPVPEVAGADAPPADTGPSTTAGAPSGVRTERARTAQRESDPDPATPPVQAPAPDPGGPAPAPPRDAVVAALRPAPEAAAFTPPPDLPSPQAFDSASAALVSRWYLPVPRDLSRPCAAVAAVGLGCHDVAADWDLLARLDRPALLERRDGGWSALLGLRGDTAWVAVPDEDRGSEPVPRSQLARAWTGRAIVFWQLPPAYRQPLRAGATGPAVAWLRERLTLARGTPDPDPSTDPDGFDGGLEARLRRFQQEQGLAVDGIAGPRTWMRLNQASGMPVPTLSEAPTDA